MSSAPQPAAVFPSGIAAVQTVAAFATAASRLVHALRLRSRFLPTRHTGFSSTLLRISASKSFRLPSCRSRPLPQVHRFPLFCSPAPTWTRCWACSIFASFSHCAFIRHCLCVVRSRKKIASSECSAVRVRRCNGRLCHWVVSFPLPRHLHLVQKTASFAKRFLLSVATYNTRLKCQHG